MLPPLRQQALFFRSSNGPTIYVLWLIHAYARYDQRYGDSSSTNNSLDHDAPNVNHSNPIRNRLMPDELGLPASSGSQTTQTWQVLHNGQSGLRQGHASQPLLGMSNTNQPALSQEIGLGATLNSPSILTRSISSDEWTMPMTMDFSSQSSIVNYNAYHAPSLPQQRNAVDVRPRNAYTTPHTSPFIPRQESSPFGPTQTGQPSTLQYATPIAPSIAPALFNNSHHVLSEFSTNQPDFSGDMQHNDCHVRRKRRDHRSSTRR